MRRVQIPWVPVLVAVVMLPVVLRLIDQAFDDAYIHYRIADHLLDHGAPYFNAGEPLKATSSTGWTLLMAAVTAVARVLEALPREWLVAPLQALLVGLGAAFWLQLLVSGPGRAAGMGLRFVFVVLYVAFMLDPAVGQMETPLALMLAGAGLLGCARGSAWGIAALVLAPFVRLELGALAVLGCAAAVWSGRVALARAAMAATVVVTPLLAVDLWFFGTVLPQTVRAKALVYGVAPADALVSAAHALAPGLKHVGLLLIAVCLALLVAGLVRAARRGWRPWQVQRDVDWALVAGGAGLATLAAYALSGAPVFPWYVPLYGVPLTLVLCSGLLHLSPGGWRHRGLLLVAFLLLAGHAGVLAKTVRAVVDDPAHWRRFDEAARVRMYRAIGSTLDRQYPGATLLTSEIGGLGDGFRGRILDAVGLVTPEALRFHPLRVPEERHSVMIGAIPTAFASHHRTELIVSYDFFARHLLASALVDEYVVTRCEVFLPEDLARRGGRPLWDSAGLYVLIRRDVYREPPAVAGCGLAQVPPRANRVT